MHDGRVGNQEQSGMHSDRTIIKMVTKLIRRLKNIFEKKLGVRLSGYRNSTEIKWLKH